jgi:hypothetical protein
VCPACKQGPPAFPYHSFCAAVFESAQKSSKVNSTDFAVPSTKNPFSHTSNTLCKIGRALEFTLPVNEDFLSKQRYRLLEDCFFQEVLMRLLYQCSENNCQCLACLYRRLARLPAELLSRHILPHIAFSHVLQTIPLYGAVLDAVSLLEIYPAKDYPNFCTKAVYETHVHFAGKSYISGLYNNSVPGSQLIKLKDSRPRYVVVWLDALGVTDIVFLSSKSEVPPQPRSKWVYAVPVVDTALVKSKVCMNRLLKWQKCSHATRVYL